MSRMTCCSCASGSGWLPACRSPFLLFFVSLFFLLLAPSSFESQAATTNCFSGSPQPQVQMLFLSFSQATLAPVASGIYQGGIMIGQLYAPSQSSYPPGIYIPKGTDLSTLLAVYAGSSTNFVVSGLTGYEPNLYASNRSTPSNAGISVGGFFSDDELRYFSSTALFTRAEEVFELAVLTRFAISKIRVQNVGIQNAATISSPRQAKFSEYFLNRVGMVNGASWWWVLATDDYFTTPVISYLKSLIISGYSLSFLKNYFQHTTGPLFMTSFNSAQVTEYVNTDLNHGLLYYSSTNPQVFDTDSKFASFAYDKWVRPSVYANVGKIYQLYQYGNIELTAVIASAVGIRLGLMLPATSPCSSGTFFTLLTGANVAISVDMDDIHIGGFTGKCSSNVDPACSCNQGGRTVWIYQLLSNAHMLDQNYTVSTSDSKCYFENEDIPIPLLVSFFSFSSGDLTTYNVTMDYVQQLLDSFGVIPRTASNAAIYFTLLNVTINQAAQEASYSQIVFSQYPGSVMVGVITTSLANYIGNQLLGIGMLTPAGASTITTYNEYSISVFPLPSSTVWFALSVPIQGSINAGDSTHNYCVPTNIIETNISGLSTPISSARTFWNCPSGFLPPGFTDTSSQYGTSWSSEISTLIPGYYSSVTSLFVGFLQTNPNASLYLYFSDFALSYNSVLSDFQTASVDVQERMYTITNLPQWNGNVSKVTVASPLLKAFQTVSNSSQWTPQHLIMFTSLLLLREAAQHASNFSAAVLSKTIYDEQSFDLLGLPLVYSSKSCSSSSIALGSAVCMGTKNDGAANAHFISMRQVIDINSIVVYPEAFASTPKTETTVTPIETHYPVYNPSTTTAAPTQIPVLSGSNKAFLALVIVFVVLSALLGLGFLGWHLFLAYRKRGFRSPQGNRPVTCVVFAFGDALSRIEKSKGRRAAEVARENLEHIVREAVKAHGLYEVVNTGGCIQAVTEDAYKAVQCCVAAQTESAKIEVQISMGVSTSLLAVKPPAEGRPRTYRGWSMTEALRIATEISNGLIVVSDKTWYAMKKSEAIKLLVPRVHRRRLLDTLTANSARHELFLDEFYIIVPPALRDEYHDTSSDFDMPDPSELLIKYFSRMGAAERASPLQSLSQSWSLPIPSRDQFDTDEEYCNAVLQQLLQELLSEQP